MLVFEQRELVSAIINKKCETKLSGVQIDSQFNFY